MKPLDFAIKIKKDNLIDWYSLPYLLISKDRCFEKQTIIIDATSENEPWKNELIKLSNSLKKSSLNEKHNKNHKKLSFSEYLKNADKSKSIYIKTQIEKTQIKILEIIKNHKPLVFENEENDNYIYEENLIQIEGNLAKIKLQFEKKKENLYYRLSVFLKDVKLNLIKNKLLILTNNSPSIIYENKLIWFGNNDFNGNKLKPFLNKEEIVINERLENIFFEKFIKPSIRKFNCTVNGFDIKELKIKPEAFVKIEQTIFDGFILTPFFEYNKHKVNFNTKVNSFVDVIKIKGDYNLEKIIRDINYENELLSKLKKIELVQKDNYFEFLKKDDDKYDFVEKINSFSSKLKNFGFTIENAVFKDKVITQKPTITYKTIQKEDWFDLYIIVNFGGFKISFQELKNNILNRVQEFKLPDGSIAIIPKTWFSELFSFVKRTKGDVTKVHKTHIIILENNKLIKPDKNIYEELNLLKSQSQIKLPNGTIATLREYQKTGYQWLYNLTKHQFGVCLADDMGLGKTLQVITLLQKYFENKSVHKNPFSNSENELQLSLFDEITVKTNKLPDVENSNSLFSALIVVPKSLIHNWVLEIQKFAKDLSYSIYYGENRQTEFKKNIHKKNIIFTTYGIVRQDIEFLKEYDFSYLILDESHTIKNPDSKIYKAVTRLNSEFRIGITGTPIENSLTDLWAQMNFLNPNMLGNLSYFEKVYKTPINTDNNSSESEELKKIINPFILRRLKKEVAKELPEKIEQIIYCRMDKEQLDWYEEEKSAVRNELISTKNNKYIDTLAVLNRLRQIAIHPKLVKKDSTMESGKFNTIIKYIETILLQGDKFLIFSSFVKHLDLFKAHFESKNIAYAMLTGKDNNREKIVGDFKKSKEIKPFLISIKAGGVGLNLIEANYVFIIDPWWNPFVEKQAIDRAHRIGQYRNVNIYKFISQNSIEEKILNLQQSKHEMSKNLIDDSHKSVKLNLKDLINLVE